MKLDLSKAYDKVSWTFIQLLLIKIGMLIDMVDWIMGCIKSSSFVVLINGAPSNIFHPSRGLRQGCSLSPFLFLLIVEALRRSIHNAREVRMIKGVKVANHIEITHVLFVDDALMFGDGTFNNL